MKFSRTWWLGGVAVFVLVFVLYLPVLEFGFLNWDDPLLVYENPRIQFLDWNHIRVMFTTTEVGAYTPLSQLSLAFDYALWKGNPFGYHLTAVLLHGLNACLVFFIARILILRSRISVGSATLTTAGFLAALLFAWHPLRVESVAWVSERRDVLSAFFSLMAVLTWLRYTRSTGAWGTRAGWYIAAFLNGVAAVFSKPVAVALPAVFLLMDFFPLQRWSAHKNGMRSNCWLLLEKTPFFAFSLACGVGTLSVLWKGGLAMRPDQIGWEQRLAQSLAADLTYLLRWFWPTNLNPLDILQKAYTMKDPQVLVSLSIHMGVTLALWLFRRRLKGGLVAWLSYLVIIAPLLGGAQSGLQFTADRYTYLASVPLCIWFGCGLVLFLGRSNGFTLLGVAPLVVGILSLLRFGWMTHRQMDVWKDSETFWTYVLKFNPDNSVALGNLGVVLTTRGDLSGAIAAYRKAIKINPHDLDAWNNLGNALGKNQNFSEAVQAYEKALALGPDHAEVHLNLASVLTDQKEYARALEHYREAYRLKPDSQIECFVAQSYENLGDASAAERWYRQSSQGKWPPAYIHWSDMKCKQGRVAEGLDLLRQGMADTRSPLVKLRFVELVLEDPHATATDLGQAAAILEQMDAGVRERSRRVQKLLQMIHHRRKLYE